MEALSQEPHRPNVNLLLNFRALVIIFHRDLTHFPLHAPPHPNIYHVYCKYHTHKHTTCSTPTSYTNAYVTHYIHILTYHSLQIHHTNMYITHHTPQKHTHITIQTHDHIQVHWRAHITYYMNHHTHTHRHYVTDTLHKHTLFRHAQAQHTTHCTNTTSHTHFLPALTPQGHGVYELCL